MNNNSDLRKEASDKIVNFLPCLREISVLFDDVTEKNNFVVQLEKLIDYIDNIFNSFAIEEIDEILGGELVIEERTVRRVKKSTSLPLFIYLDLFNAVNECFLEESSKYEYKQEMNKNCKIVREKIKNLKEKVSKLSCSDKFNKKYHLSKEIGKKIINSQGFIVIDFQKKESKEYLVMEFSHVFSSNSANTSNINIYRGDVNFAFLYYEDELEYENIIQEKKQKELQSISVAFISEVKEFFKNEKLPDNIDNVAIMLVDRAKVDYDFRICLQIAVKEYLKCVKYGVVTSDFKKSFDNFLIAKTELERNEKEEKERKKKEEYKNNNLAEPNKVMEKNEKERTSEARSKKGFSNFINLLKNKRKEKVLSDDVLTFENERKKQLISDAQGRKYIVTEVVMIDGKEVYVPMGSDDVKVVRK